MKLVTPVQHCQNETIKNLSNTNSNPLSSPLCNLLFKISDTLKVPSQQALAYLLSDRFVVMVFQLNNGHYGSPSLDSVDVLGDSISSNTIFMVFLPKPV